MGIRGGVKSKSVACSLKLKHAGVFTSVAFVCALGPLVPNRAIAAPANMTRAADEAPEVTLRVSEVTQEQAYAAITALRSQYPEGMTWNSDSHYYSEALNYGGFGCAGFALIASDAAFGDNPVSYYYDLAYVRVGDILSVNYGMHYVVVLEVRPDGVVVTEGNYNDTIHWGRFISYDELSRGFGSGITRYLTSNIPERTHYKVTAPTSTPGGMLVVCAEEAEAGEEVVVFPFPDGGYRLSEISVVDSSGSPVTISPTTYGDGSWSFVMPTADVIVDATFSYRIDLDAQVFPDVPNGQWYTDGVKWVVANEIMNGHGSGLFDPEGPVTRGQLARMLWNQAGQPAVFSDLGDYFVDCDPNGFYAKGVVWCAERSYMSGYGNGAFAPDKPMTREELVTVLWRICGEVKIDYDLSEHSDAGLVSAYARDALAWAVSEGVLMGQGEEGLLGPQGIVTRAQAATIFMRLFS